MPVIIDMEKCGKIKDCPGEGLCIKICEQGALIEEKDELTLYPDKCDDCDLCIQNCPNQAISKLKNKEI
jgi:NAD-dependent dihydropyrimidine dehydrogenase PreA subunit